MLPLPSPCPDGLYLYLDPGTGSLLFSVLVGLVSTGYFLLHDALYRIRTRARMLLSRGRSRQDEAGEQPMIVLYSEGRQYASTFGPLLEAMQRRGVPGLYLSSDVQDPLLQFGQGLRDARIRTEFIGGGARAWGRLCTLRAPLVCMTTPGLDVLQIRRSPHVGHYMHIVHSPTDKSFNRPYSFDYFDSVVINGPHQARVIRQLEQLRHRKVKALHLLGCVYYDRLLPAYRAAVAQLPPRDPEAGIRVLLAPTWGKNGLLSRFGLELIHAIEQAGLALTIRPHPQMAQSEAELLLSLQDATAHLPTCRWDFAPDPVPAMADSDILLSDISGIVFDYAFLTGRPVLTLDLPIDKRGFEAMDLPFEPWDLECLDILGRRISWAELPRLPEIIRDESTSRRRSAQIDALRREFVVHFGQSSERVVDCMARFLGPQAAAPTGAGRPLASTQPRGGG